MVATRDDSMRPEPRSPWRTMVAVFVAGFVLRAIFFFVVTRAAPAFFPAIVSRVGEAHDGYREIALQLIGGHGFAFDEASGPTAARAPLYPLLLAAVYRAFGTGPEPVLWVHAVLGALTCSLVYLLGRRVFDHAVGLTAGLLTAAYPPHIWWSQYILSETLLVLLITASFIALLDLARNPSTRRAIVSGALFGLTALCNAMILFFPPLLVVLAALSAERRRRYLRLALVMVATMGVIILPWTVRNALTFHRLIPVNWSLGSVYLFGLIMVDDYVAGRAHNLGQLNDRMVVEGVRILRANGFDRQPYEEQLLTLRTTMCLSLEEDEFFKRLSLERVTKEPFLAVRKFVMNLWFYWYLSIRLQVLQAILNFTLLGLALLGLAWGAARAPEKALMSLYCLYFYLSYSAVLASARFVVQIAPFLTVLAAVPLVMLARRFSGIRRARV